jgi:serralysin
MAENAGKIRICFDRVIPESMNPGKAIRERAAFSNFIAAVQAKSGAPSHLSLSEHVERIGPLPELNADDPIHLARMALINLKKWDNNYNLRCRFLDGSDKQQEKLIEKAKIWEKFAAVKISFVEDSDAEIRISFAADPGSWSAVGTDCLDHGYFPLHQPTMNFGWLHENTDEDEWERVVVHEFGHALGCIHEHQSPSEHLKWNKTAVYKAFSGPPNFWSKEEIDFNVLQKYSRKGMTYSIFDPESIMLYQFDGSLFTDHKGTPLNTHLSKLDKQMITRMYPKTATAAIGMTA